MIQRPICIKNPMIEYRDNIDKITENQLQGFFVGWPDPPSPKIHLKILAQSSYRIIAVDNKTNQVVGFITAISDEVLSAYIPLLEVLPKYHNQGIGKQLARQILDKLKHLYMVDLVCDRELESFYKRLDMQSGFAMLLRNYSRQSGC